MVGYVLQRTCNLLVPTEDLNIAEHGDIMRYHIPVAICKGHLCCHIRLAFSRQWNKVRHHPHTATLHIQYFSFTWFPFSVHLNPLPNTLSCKHHFSFSRFSAVWHLKSMTPPRDSWEACHLLWYAMLFKYGQRCEGGGSATSLATHTE